MIAALLATGVLVGLTFGAIGIAATGTDTRRAWLLRKTAFALLAAGFLLLGFITGYLTATWP